MRYPWILVASFTVALGGCATPAEQAARLEREMDRLMEIYGPACERLGYQRDSDPWRNCVLRLTERDSYERYGRYPLTTTCFGQPGFLHCTQF